MSRAGALGAVEYATESSWGESSSTFGSRLAVLGDVDPSGLEQSKTAAQRTVQYANDGTMPIRGIKGGSFKTDLWLPGHGVAPSGTIAYKDHETILRYVLGAITGTGLSDVIATGGSTTTATAAALSMPVGGIVYCGVKGDSHGDGQAAVVASEAAGTITFLNAMAGATANNDEIDATVTVSTIETPANLAVQSFRFRLLTANQQYACHGCYPTSLSISGLNPGEIPRASITWAVSWWEPVSATFPSAVSVDAYNPAPCAGGSFFFQARGTTTRQTYSLRSFALNINLGIVPLMGPEGIDANQVVIGAVRTPMDITASFEVDAQTASASPTWPGRWDSDSQFYHLLYTLSGAAAGKRVALYMPNVCIVDRKPTQHNRNGVNAEAVTVRAYTGATTTTDLTLSALRIGLG